MLAHWGKEQWFVAFASYGLLLWRPVFSVKMLVPEWEGMELNLL